MDLADREDDPMPEQELTAPQRALVETWERHMAAEFDTKSIDATMATMTADPVVNHVPVMTGGVGAREVRHFYTHYFIHRHPPGTTIVEPAHEPSNALIARARKSQQ